MRVFEELRGISASFRVAAKRSSIGSFLSRAIVLSFARRLANFFAILRRLLFFSTELFFAILSLLAVPRMRPASLPEREVKRGKQRTRFIVVARAGTNGDVKTPGI